MSLAAEIDVAPPFEPELEPACELRVLSGLVAGAAAVLPLRRWVEVGHALTSDLVIRDPTARGVRLRLRARDGAAELDLVEGEASLLGHALTAPATAILPAYVPLIVGGSAIAFGEPGARRWDEALRLLRADRDEAEPSAEDVGAPAPPVSVAARALAVLDGAKGAWPVAAGAAAAVALAALVWSPLIGWLNSAPSPEQAGAALARDGFPALNVVGGDNGLTARGVLRRASDLARLRGDIARRRWPMALEVQTDDQLRQGVADVLKANGYDAGVSVLAPGILAAEIRGGDMGKVEAVRAEALRDNPGLRQLVIKGLDGAAPRSLTPADPNKRVVALVGGEMGYVQTADGARYFMGSILPSGHRITAITDHDVSLDLNGKAARIAF